MHSRTGVWAHANEVDLLLGDDLVASGYIAVESYDSERSSCGSVADLMEKLSMSSSRLSSQRGSTARGSRGSKD